MVHVITYVDYTCIHVHVHVCCHGDTGSPVQEMLAFSEGPVTLEDVLSMRGRTVAPPPATPTGRTVAPPPATPTGKQQGVEGEGGVVYLGATSALPSHSSIHHFCTGQPREVGSEHPTWTRMCTCECVRNVYTYTCTCINQPLRQGKTKQLRLKTTPIFSREKTSCLRQDLNLQHSAY